MTKNTAFGSACQRQTLKLTMNISDVKILIILSPGVVGLDGVGVVELVEAQGPLMGKPGGVIVFRPDLS
jgi:hypothetical protein